ncbi:PTS sugar transporter subunit IIA [Lacrimispora xylanisolvens]|uniref:PTS sugar transporter subunit IIA n=1 Tax=Lacrimispora xylanisolvens TaxID=384636 RepID=UPI0024027BA5|nr:PTS glucose transporter subunit IIA [Paenibacillaceae bacterium]
MFEAWKKYLKRGGGNKEEILAPVEGLAVPLSEVKDPAFSQEILGKGMAIIPSKGRIVAPVSGVLSVMFETMHAVSITADNGAEVMIHVGLDTVKLKGEGFQSFKKQGERVKAGELLLEFDLKGIQAKGYDLITPVIILNTMEYPDMKCHVGKHIMELEPIIEL